MTLRIKQHKYSVRTGQNSNALFVHLSSFGHPIGWEDAKELVYCNDFVKRNIIESCIIKHNSSDGILNISPGLFKLDAFIIKEVINKFKFRF